MTASGSRPTAARLHSAHPAHLSRARVHEVTAVSTASPSDEPISIGDVAELGTRLGAQIRSAMTVSGPVLDTVLVTVLAGGHLLVEDHPGVGKTLLARVLAGSIGGKFGRVQATVDLLPGDIVGANVWQPGEGEFVFRPGPVFANVVLVDELNRASPKTQSGLLEAMEEEQVTVDGTSWPIPRPCFVIATQNPGAGSDGTYALPPAQLDRFLARVSLGYPDAAGEIALLRTPPPDASPPVTDALGLLEAQRAVESVHASDAVIAYVVELVRFTRAHARVAVGASPRAAVWLLRAARARAALEGRDFVVPDDVRALAAPVLAHRLELANDDWKAAAEAIVRQALTDVRIL
jgi:MoxR-like ATPase